MENGHIRITEISNDHFFSVKWRCSPTAYQVMITNITIRPVGQLQVPGTPHRSRQHPVSFFVVNEFFSFGVPSEFAAQPYGNIIQVADGVGANSGFDGANRFLSGLNTIQEITTMISRSRQVHLIGTNS